MTKNCSYIIIILYPEWLAFKGAASIQSVQKKKTQKNIALKTL